MPKSSSYKFINSLFEGKAPMTVIENEMISLDVWQFREFMAKELTGARTSGGLCGLIRRNAKNLTRT